MKKLILTLSILTFNLFAIDKNYETLITLSKVKELSIYVQHEKEIINSMENYLINTADFNLSNLSQADKLTYLTKNFKGYHNDIVDVNVSYIKNNRFLYNVINMYNSTKEKQEIDNIFQNNNYRTDTSITKFQSNGLSYTSYYPSSSTLKLYKLWLDNINNNNIKISPNSPTNTNLVWFKPNPNGYFDIYNYNVSKYEYVGNTITGIITNDKTILNKIKGNNHAVYISK